MRSIDTNVLARWVLGDDPAQAPVAAAVLAEPVFVPLTVLLELGWVLHKALGFSRDVATDLLEQVLALDTAMIEHAALARWATTRFREGADWGDMLHLAASANDATEFVTFDRRLAHRAGADAPLPVAVLDSRISQ